jgi:hypothetical protein
MTKRRIWIGAVVACIFCGTYLWLFGVATALALEARYFGWKMPAVNQTPKELADRSICQAVVKKVSYLGYDFDVPWEIDNQKTRLIGRMQLISLRSGNAILFSKTAPGEFVQTLSSSSQVSLNDLKKLYGPDALDSDYSLHRRILDATPGKITPFSGRSTAVSTAMLVMVKGIMLPAAAESGLFHVAASGYEGFQYGDPRRRPKSISVEIYGSDGDLGFIFTQFEKGSVPPITQAEINRIIGSIQRVAERQALAAEADSRTRW